MKRFRLWLMTLLAGSSIAQMTNLHFEATDPEKPANFSVRPTYDIRRD